jgi:hypothetical protein
MPLSLWFSLYGRRKKPSRRKLGQRIDALKTKTVVLAGELVEEANEIRIPGAEARAVVGFALTAGLGL